jgi:hypothetical protein
MGTLTHEREDHQSNAGSWIESVCNIASGYIIAFVVWIYFVMPVYNIQTTMYENLTITFLFSLISIIRGYVWRRIFIRYFRG